MVFDFALVVRAVCLDSVVAFLHFASIALGPWLLILRWFAWPALRALWFPFRSLWLPWLSLVCVGCALVRFRYLGRACVGMCALWFPFSSSTSLPDPPLLSLPLAPCPLHLAPSPICLQKYNKNNTEQQH